jgi:hypothetical protein
VKWFGLALLYLGLPLLLAEITEVAPWLAERLLKSAARLLPTRHRERYIQEWLAELDAVPGKLLKFLFAARIALRVPATRRELQHTRPIWVIVGRWLLASIITIAIAVARLASQLLGRLSTPSPNSEPDLRPNSEPDLRLVAEDGSVTVIEAKVLHLHGHGPLPQPPRSGRWTTNYDAVLADIPIEGLDLLRELPMPQEGGSQDDQGHS